MGVPILRGNININLKSLYKNHFMVNLCPIYIGSFIEPFVSGFCCCLCPQWRDSSHFLSWCHTDTYMASDCKLSDIGPSFPLGSDILLLSVSPRGEILLTSCPGVTLQSKHDAPA